MIATGNDCEQCKLYGLWVIYSESQHVRCPPLLHFLELATDDELSSFAPVYYHVYCNIICWYLWRESQFWETLWQEFDYLSTQGKKNNCQICFITYNKLVQTWAYHRYSLLNTKNRFIPRQQSSRILGWWKQNVGSISCWGLHENPRYRYEPTPCQKSIHRCFTCREVWIDRRWIWKENR